MKLGFIELRFTALGFIPQAPIKVNVDCLELVLGTKESCFLANLLLWFLNIRH